MVLPDVSNLRPVAQLPAVRGFVLPADVPRVPPEQLHLSRRVSGVPQGIPQELTWTGPGLHRLQDGHRDECVCLPTAPLMFISTVSCRKENQENTESGAGVTQICSPVGSQTSNLLEDTAGLFNKHLQVLQSQQELLESGGA